MQTHCEFKITLELVRQRLDEILNFTFDQLAVKQKAHPNKILYLNESLLEQWSDLLGRMIRWKDHKTVPIKATRTVGKLKDQHEIKIVPIVPPLIKNDKSNKVLLNVGSTYVDVFDIKENVANNMVSISAEKSRLEFKKGVLHRYCSYTCCDAQNVVLIGGCRHSNPNLKSQQMLNLNLITKEVIKIGDLPYGVSSHGAIKIGSKIYIVGGNKNHNIVTKKCLEYDIVTNIITKISDLNYPSASHALLEWNEKYVYKFGGIGSCFGEWDLSPYIQRYSISLDQWDIINPNVNINQNLLHHYSLLVNSVVYRSTTNSIVVLGGFDFQKKGSTKMFEIAVKESTNEEGKEEVHEIVALGEVEAMKPGGFCSQEIVTIGRYLFALEAINTEKGLEHSVVRIGKDISYLS